MKKYSVTVTRNFTIYETIDIEVEATDEEEAKKFALEDSENATLFLDADYIDPEIYYEIDEVVEID